MSIKLIVNMATYKERTPANEDPKKNKETENDKAEQSEKFCSYWPSICSITLCLFTLRRLPFISFFILLFTIGIIATAAFFVNRAFELTDYEKQRIKAGYNDTFIYEWKPDNFEKMLTLDSAFLAKLAYKIHAEDVTSGSATNIFEDKIIKSTNSCLKNIKKFSGEEHDFGSTSHGFTAILENDSITKMTLTKDGQKYSFVIVAFRGTSDNDDILSDLDASMNALYGIHLGFIKRFEHHPWIKPMLDLLESNEGMRILFTGHSLGGAESMVAPVFLDYILPKESGLLSLNSFDGNPQVDAGKIDTSLMAEDLYNFQASYSVPVALQLKEIDEKNYEILKNFFVINFGAPRPGGKKFKKLYKEVSSKYNGKSLRVTNIGDPVVRLPSQSLMGFMHCIDDSIMIYGQHHTQEVSDASSADHYHRDEEKIIVDCNHNHKYWPDGKLKDYYCNLSKDKYDQAFDKSDESLLTHIKDVLDVSLEAEAHSMSKHLDRLEDLLL